MIRLVPGAGRLTRTYQFLWSGIFLAIVVVSFMLHPSMKGHGTHTQLGLPPCPSVLMFNRPCPGCGMTTSFAYMAHGDVLNGFRVHPFGPILFIGWGITAFLGAYGAFKGLRLDTDSRSFQWVLGVFALSFFIYGAVRFQQGFGPPQNSPVAVQAPR